MGDRGEVPVTWPGFELDGTAAKRLRAAGLRLRLEPKTGRRTSADVERLTRGAVAATISTDPFDRSVLAAADQLGVIARVGVGTDTIDLAAATAEGMVVTITPGANQETTADHAVAMMLAALRRIVEHDASVRRGEWERGAGLTPWDVHGVVVGIVGYGAIGRAVAGPRRAGRHTERPARPASTAQIESPAIAAHVDTLVAGTADLAMTMAEHAVSRAVADVERAAREAGTRFGLAGGDAALLALCAQPPEVLMCAVDIRLAARAADEAAAAARSGGALVRD